MLICESSTIEIVINASSLFQGWVMTACCSSSALYSPLPLSPVFLSLHSQISIAHLTMRDSIPQFPPSLLHPDLFLLYVFSKHFCFLSEPPKKAQTSYPDVFSRLFPVLHSGPFNTWTTKSCQFRLQGSKCALPDPSSPWLCLSGFWWIALIEKRGS